ncbi:Glycosyltransferase involved in cell wall bisynthesis [Desulfomicrobium apsheronum]|uniref:Glycosyltransferase involved in cell wall bisynthesis n=1 Tax=Desulfomicrobium apsheronum TaxID=52560 RepID=A0A1I3VRL7_9BACT|nr:glycosyltransferase family 4 protein [Desulfomicrobium apsheronum]SFJ97792.1 Glycosyltransferase involved in cell wall bisynthesis [Desulfomicrobium apsheronum]
MFFKKGELFFASDRCVTIWGMRWLLRQFPKAAKSAYEPVPKSLLYVPASSLPYHISGYTTRTHAVIRALRDAGANVHVLTRPGYPWDRRDRVAEPGGSETTVDGIVYTHAQHPANNRHVLQFAVQASKVIAEAAQKNRVAAIHAASNHTNALPALFAARELGIPFHYEMRGLWELTRASRMAWFENTARYKQGLELEALVARNADRLFVISKELGRYAQENWGVRPERMALLPNCVDPEAILPVDPARAEPNTIGYAGSIMPYEGLDTLIEAVAMLADRGLEVRVKIVGDGEAKSGLEELSNRLGQNGRVEFLGRVHPARALEIMERCAIVCLPRKPFQVCEIVPPIKLVEALAMAKPVIVPDLPVFRDELGTDPAGWFFRAGDAVNLAEAVEQAFSNPARLSELGAKAREYVLAHRTWGRFVGNVIKPHEHDEARACSA